VLAVPQLQQTHMLKAESVGGWVGRGVGFWKVRCLTVGLEGFLV
jgi:hypothetical protein